MNNSNPNKIAAEAAEQIHRKVQQQDNFPLMREEYTVIIQAAIEKAKDQWIANLSGEPAGARELIVPRAAHASEGGPLSPRGKAYDWNPAHAGEQSDDTKRLDWLTENIGKFWVTTDSKLREEIDAAMSPRKATHAARASDYNKED